MIKTEKPLFSVVISVYNKTGWKGELGKQ